MNESNHEYLTFLGFCKNVHIFISHSGEDAQAAMRYRDYLKKSGFPKAWTYEDRLNIGSEIETVVEDRIRECHFFILLATDAARRTLWVQRELGLAREIADLRGNFQPFIIPIKPGGPESASNWRTIFSRKSLRNRLSPVSRPLLAENNEFREFPCKRFYPRQKDEGAQAAASPGDDLARRRAPSDSWLRRSRIDRSSLKEDEFEDLKPYPLNKMRVFDESKPGSNNIDFLVESMTPRFIDAQQDIETTDELIESGVFDLYDDLFVEEERIPHSQFIRLFEKQPGTKVVLSDPAAPHGKCSYIYDKQHVLRILSLNDQAIGFALVSYDPATKFFFGSYLAVHKCWRAHNMAGKFWDLMWSNIAQSFEQYRGIVFEVEPVDFERVENIITRLENSKRTTPVHEDALDKEEADTIRKFIRVYHYSKKALFFVDKDLNPIRYHQPCLDAGNPAEWETFNWTLWLAFMHPEDPGSPPVIDSSNSDALWRDALNCVVVEIVGKTYAMDVPACGAQYLKYTEAVRDKTLQENHHKRPALGPVINKQREKLYSRWLKLKIELAL